MGGEIIMNVAIIHQTVTKHDAIGNDIEAMFHFFNRMGTCLVYAEHQFNDCISYISKTELLKWIQEKDNLLIYHHSVFWEDGERILDACCCKIIIRYHNITPPAFFQPYNQHHFNQCRLCLLYTSPSPRD